MAATPNHGVSSKLIACAVSSQGGPPLTCIQARWPRMVHADFLTHRVLSRNGRSSRAVPVVTLLEEARNPFVPEFLANQRGMVGADTLSPEAAAEAESVWRWMAQCCREGVAILNDLKVSKQYANRPLEWFGYIDVLVSSTSWANFFALRDDEGAQPEIQEMARQIRAIVTAAEQDPDILAPGEWQLPYVSPEEIEEYGGRTDPTGFLRQLSTARCARLTIRPFDGDASIEAEKERYHRLMTARPVHASPAEHVATPDTWNTNKGWWSRPDLHGNFTGFRQHRKEVPYESIPG